MNFKDRLYNLFDLSRAKIEGATGINTIDIDLETSICFVPSLTAVFLVSIEGGCMAIGGIFGQCSKDPKAWHVFVGGSLIEDKRKAKILKLIGRVKYALDSEKEKFPFVTFHPEEISDERLMEFIKKVS